jgi:GT2 family glycosyltransferase
MKKIPVIGTAVVANPEWVQRLYISIDYPTEVFVIFNNSGKKEIADELENLRHIPHEFVSELKICHLPTNIGVSGAWNMIIKSYLMAPYWIITNDDVSFTEGFLKEMVTEAIDEEVGIVHGYGGDFGDGAWDLFLIKDWVIQSHGLFDENLYPAYCEDADYTMRLAAKPIKRITSLEKTYYHGEGLASEYYTYGSKTKKTSTELYEKLTEVNLINFNYMTEKWGPGWRQTNPWKRPYDVLPIFYTSYDLKFVRKKYLGF